jgi:hypothetical protein
VKEAERVGLELPFRRLIAIGLRQPAVTVALRETRGLRAICLKRFWKTKDIETVEKINGLSGGNILL